MSCRLSVQTLKDCDISSSIFSNFVFNNARKAVVYSMLAMSYLTINYASLTYGTKRLNR